MSPIFTKKHYDVIAKSINKIVYAYNLEAINGTEQEKAVRAIVMVLDAMFRADNPNYSSDRFWDACYSTSIKPPNLPKREWEHTMRLKPSTNVPHEPKPYARIGNENRCETCGDIIVEKRAK